MAGSYKLCCQGERKAMSAACFDRMNNRKYNERETVYCTKDVRRREVNTVKEKGQHSSQSHDGHHKLHYV
jgi:hypothetical protein